MFLFKRSLLMVMILSALVLCAGAESRVQKSTFGRMEDGTPVDLYTLKSESLEATVCTYGGRLVTLRVPDRNGAIADVVLGFDNLEGYLGRNPFFGALVGRYANRIAHGLITLDGREYALGKAATAEHSLHGGVKGFDKRVWSAKIDRDTLVLTYLSKDGEEGYPGNLTATVKYTVRGKDLEIEYWATTDKNTVVNLTNHSYFNLAGEGAGDVLSHEIRIIASRFLPVDKGLIPTGEIRSVEGTPFDFRSPRRIGDRIEQDSEQLKFGGGYDHNWVLDSGGGKPALAARVKDPASGRVMEVLTTEPGIQFYTGNNLNGAVKGKGGKAYPRRGALCLETQHYPDSPNQKLFPSTELKPGQKFTSRTVFRFSVE
jgi:aldose 1-epimerase